MSCYREALISTCAIVATGFIIVAMLAALILILTVAYKGSQAIAKYGINQSTKGMP